MSRKPFVVYWNNQPAPNVVDRFNALMQRESVEFEAWFSEFREPGRSWQVTVRDWLFPSYVLSQTTRTGLPIRQMRSKRPDVLVTIPASAKFAIGAAAARVFARRLCLRVLPTYDAWNKRTLTKEFAKKRLYRLADTFKVPGPDGAEAAKRYGATPDQIFFVRQSINVEHFMSATRLRESASIKRRRLELGLKGCVFLYVGRIWKGKGLDTLFMAFDRLRREASPVSLLVVGDGSDLLMYQSWGRQIGNVVFQPFVQQSELPHMYALGDLFVFPTLGDPYGLVIDEAKAAGLPVIVSEAAGDVRNRITHTKAGLLFPPQNVDQLLNRMRDLAADEVRRKEMGRFGIESVAENTHARWASDFEALIEFTLARPRSFVESFQE